MITRGGFPLLRIEGEVEWKENVHKGIQGGEAGLIFGCKVNKIKYKERK